MHILNFWSVHKSDYFCREKIGIYFQECGIKTTGDGDGDDGDDDDDDGGRCARLILILLQKIIDDCECEKIIQS
jgi:hypothetical protein